MFVVLRRVAPLIVRTLLVDHIARRIHSHVHGGELLLHAQLLAMMAAGAVHAELVLLLLLRLVPDVVVGAVGVLALMVGRLAALLPKHLLLRVERMA